MYMVADFMIIFQELEAMRKRILQEINTEFDVIIEHLSKDLNENSNEYIQPYEMKYPLTAGSGIFKGKKPTSVIIGSESISIRTWKQLVEEIMKRCMASEKYNKELENLAGKVSGKKRTLLAKTSDGMRSPLKIGENLFMETHYDTETLLNILMTRLLIPIGYDYSSISVTVRTV